MERRQQVAEQLKTLMDRHGLTPAEIERRTGGDGRPPVSAVTVRRILKSEARTEPEPLTLRRIAECVGERYTAVFAETEDSLTVDVSQRGVKFNLRFLGTDPPEGLEQDLRKVLDRYEQRLSRPGLLPMSKK